MKHITSVDQDHRHTVLHVGHTLYDSDIEAVENLLEERRRPVDTFWCTTCHKEHAGSHPVLTYRCRQCPSDFTQPRPAGEHMASTAHTLDEVAHTPGERPSSLFTLEQEGIASDCAIGKRQRALVTELLRHGKAPIFMEHIPGASSPMSRRYGSARVDGASFSNLRSRLRLAGFDIRVSGTTITMGRAR